MRARVSSHGRVHSPLLPPVSLKPARLRTVPKTSISSTVSILPDVASGLRSSIRVPRATTISCDFGTPENEPTIACEIDCGGESVRL